MEIFSIFKCAAAMRLIAPKANPGIYIPMALGVTFSMNITIGMPLFYYLIMTTS